MLRKTQPPDGPIDAGPSAVKSYQKRRRLMSEKKAAGKRAHAEGTPKSAKGSAKLAAKKSHRGRTSTGFTDEERAAMKERAQELKAAARADKDEREGESAVLAKIAE